MADEFGLTTQAWLTRAKHDVETARVVATHRPDLLDTAIYHCQQAGEKALKALIVSQGNSVPKTHDLDKLIELGAKIAPALASLQPLADLLTPLATAFRYPADDEAPMPTSDQFAEALDAAQQLFDFVLSLLPTDIHPG